MFERWPGGGLKLALLAVFVISTNHGLGRRVLTLADQDAWLALVAFAGIWAASLAALGVVTFLPRFWARAPWAVLICASSLLGDLVYSVTGTHLSLYEVALYWSERAHWAAAAELYYDRAPLAIAKVVVGAVAIGLPFRLPRQLPRWLVAVPVLPLALVAALLLAAGGRGTAALPEQFNAAAMVGVLAVKDPFGGRSVRRQDVRLRVTGSPQARHVVLVVDESVRGDFLQPEELGRVLPYIASRQGEFADFGIAVSGNNCSIFSNLILRFGGVRGRLSHSLRTGASIWSHARLAGYRTVYIDGQKTGGRLQNGMTIVERGGIDEFIQLGEVPITDRDAEIARLLRTFIGARRPHFVYVNKRGSHFPYARNYPREEAPFQPDMQKGEPHGGSREHLLNSYRNSLRWTVDGFFRELLSEDLEDALILYTSDHGQNLMDGSGVAQCNAADPHVFEALVPLRTIGGPAVLRRRLQAMARINRDRASHFEIFPTLLQVFGFAPEAVRALYGPSLLEPLAPRERAFTYGPIIGWTGRHPRWKAVPADLRSLLAGSRSPAVPGAGSGDSPQNRNAREPGH